MLEMAEGQDYQLAAQLIFILSFDFAHYDLTSGHISTVLIFRIGIIILFESHKILRNRFRGGREIVTHF